MMFSVMLGAWSCPVAVTYFAGIDTKDGAAYWHVACTSGRAYAVTIADDAEGSTRIMDCPFAKTLGLTCFKKWGVDDD